MNPLIDVTALSKDVCRIPIQAQLKYATVQNFLGRVVDGYQPDLTDLCLMTPKAGEALCRVQNYLIEKYEYGILVYDAYRPKRAVHDFLAWSNAAPLNDFELARKAIHYPHLEKKDLFSAGYVAEDSGHCYGNTVDLILINLKTGTNLDMGVIFDYMDEKSHWSAPAKLFNSEIQQNRQILLEAMKKHQFEPFAQEVWHFSYGGDGGREVSSPLDIEITAQLRGLGSKDAIPLA